MAVLTSPAKETPIVEDPAREWKPLISLVKLKEGEVDSENRLTLFRSAPSPNKTESEVTFSLPGSLPGAKNNFAWYMGATSRPNVVQVAKRGFWELGGGAATEGSVTFANPGSGPVVVFGAIMDRDGRPFIAGPGFRFMGADSCQLSEHISRCLQGEWRNDFVQTVTLKWTDPAKWMAVGAQVQ